MTDLIRRFLDILDHATAGGVTEVCVFQGGKVPTHVGYFNDLDKAVKAIESHDERGNIFVTLNPAKRDLLARANNHLIEGSYKRPIERTKDHEILRDSWFLLDVDPKRPSGISSTDGELHEAIEVAKAARDWLLSVGVPASAVLSGQSGNGAYVLIRLPNYEVTDECITIKKTFMGHIADLFDNDQVEVDRTVFNPARLVCALGTLKVKGENIAERPHRRSMIRTISGKPFDPAKDQRCEPFDLYALAARILPLAKPPGQKQTGTGAQHSATGNKSYELDIREIAEKFDNTCETSRGFVYADCPNCGGSQKLFYNTLSGAYGCFHFNNGSCNRRDLRTKLREIAGAEGRQFQQQTNQAGARQAPPSQDPKKSGPNAADREPVKLAVSWADFDAEQFVQGERIAFAVERGEIALLNALPNAGKTTLALNVAVSLAAGRSFFPVVDRDTPQRVLYIDGETRRPRLQRDIRTMTKGFDRETAIRVGQNLHVVCEAEISSESLALTRTDHLLEMSVEALRVKPDFIVIDTLSSLCPVFNENDNAEQTRKVWRPLQKLARDCDAAILVLHHVGKRNEDSQAPERVYRGRGASASGGAARAVWLLTPDPVTPGLSTLACVKVKGEPPADTRLQLDPGTRWIGALKIEHQKITTPLERVLQVVNREMRTAEIKAALKPDLGDRTVETAIAEAVQLEKLKVVKRGVYRPSKQTAETAEAAKDLFAVSAETTEESEKGVENEFPQLPHPPICAAETAETINGNSSKRLEQQSQNLRNHRLRKADENGKAGSTVPHEPHSPMTSTEHTEMEEVIL